MDYLSKFGQSLNRLAADATADIDAVKLRILEQLAPLPEDGSGSAFWTLSEKEDAAVFPAILLSRAHQKGLLKIAFSSVANLPPDRETLDPANFFNVDEVEERLGISFGLPADVSGTDICNLVLPLGKAATLIKTIVTLNDLEDIRNQAISDLHGNLIKAVPQPPPLKPA